MSQLFFLLLNLYIQMVTFTIKAIAWFIRKPGWWLLCHPFQLSCGILGSYVIFHSPLMVNGSGVTIIAFMLGASIAHLLDSTVLADESQIRSLVFPMTGFVAGIAGFRNLVDLLLLAAIVFALVFGCSYQARNPN